ncbi:MAG TPA: hypothetical protein VGL03_07105 [Thermoanaerobaculia bacterium]
MTGRRAKGPRPVIPRRTAPRDPEFDAEKAVSSLGSLAALGMTG